MRKPIVAGQFYAGTKEELNKEIDSCFKHALGAGIPKVPLREKKIYGVIVPHAGYIYSGPCASWAYKQIGELKKTNFPDIFILLGPNHSSYTTSVFSLTSEDFQTPLGIMKNDTEFSARLLKEASHLGLSEDTVTHEHEHSLEVQIPFLQFVSSFVKKEPKIVPIVISTLEYDKLLAFGRKIADIIKEEKKNICILTSSDFTHYGGNYGFLPFPSQEAKIKLKELDKKSIKHILNLDSKEFYKEATKTTICGASAITTAIEICKALGSKKAELLKYYTSSDITRDYSNAVGYASLVFE